jgi:hypothetical protein
MLYDGMIFGFPGTFKANRYLISLSLCFRRREMKYRFLLRDLSALLLFGSSP